MIVAHGDPLSHAVLTFAGTAAIAIYALAWWRRPAGRPEQLVAWTLGVLSLLVALSPPFERLAAETFRAHMIQHLVLLIVAAPLLVAAAPYDLWASTHGSLRGPGHSGRSTLRAAAPTVAPVMFVGTLALTHLTPIYDQALRHTAVHDLEHAAYLGAAVSLWGAVRAAGRRHASRRLGAVFAVIAGTALVSMVMLAADSPLIATYERRLGRDGAMADQQAAAAIMWVSGMAVTLPLLIVAVWRWAAAEQRATERREELLEARYDAT
jgi:cytochrome c oxidase assembly factor CtaG